MKQITTTETENLFTGEKAFSNLKRIVFRFRNQTIFLFQITAIIVSYLFSFGLRFDFDITQNYYILMLKTLPVILFSRLFSYYLYNIHKDSWVYISIKDLMNTIKAVGVGTIANIIMIAFIFSFDGYPRSVLIIDMAFNLLLIGGCRFSLRYYKEFYNKRSSARLSKKDKNVLIVGAGKAGTIILNELSTHPELGINIIGFIDDNPFKKGRTIQGYPVLGTSKEMLEIIDKYNIDEVLIAIPSAPYKEIARIKNIANKAGVATKRLPGLGELICNGSLSSQLKDVSCDELLGRKVLKFRRSADIKKLKEEIEGKVVLITGAGGSIGSELSRQVSALNPKKIILYERYENGLYDIELELKKKYRHIHIEPVIGDILDTKKLDHIFSKEQVDIVYHAAAYKHVPMMERAPLDAVRNNVFGTRNVAELSIKHGVKKFILISTDKAVNPANVMGTTKRVAELIVQSLNGKGTKFIAVRFGNVLGSNGSVIPLFKKQIEEGGPVTVTHPEITRYFMAISEAVQLVMTAGAMGKGGEIFLLDMGKPVKIVDLAKELIRKSGLEPGKDIDIVFTGLRPGEKLHEELYWKGEGIVPTENKKITMLKANGRISDIDLNTKLQELENSVEVCDLPATLKTLKEIVPEATIDKNEHLLKVAN